LENLFTRGGNQGGGVETVVFVHIEAKNKLYMLLEIMPTWRCYWLLPWRWKKY
jgi:hypothetical protein